MTPRGLLTPEPKLYHHAWKRTATAHFIRQPCPFRKPISQTTSVSDEGVVSIHSGSLASIGGRSTAVVGQLNCSPERSAQRYRECSQDKSTSRQILWSPYLYLISVGQYSKSVIKGAIIAHSRSHLHSCAFSHTLLLAIIFQIPGQLKSQGFIHPILWHPKWLT